MITDGYLRRVKDPDPLRLELARQAVDAVVARSQQPAGSAPPFYSTRLIAGEFGVPLDYILDELERRARARPA